MDKPKPLNVRIEHGDKRSIDSLRPLWLGLHHHHQNIAPSLAPYVEDDASWSVRQKFYMDCLSHKDSFVLLAYAGEDLVGYALVLVQPTSTMWTDTWVVGDRAAELETIVVAPQFRGQGIGARLLDHVDAELGRLGINDMMIGVVATNLEVVELYRRHGFEATWLVMTRFAKRNRTNQEP